MRGSGLSVTTRNNSLGQQPDFAQSIMRSLPFQVAFVFALITVPQFADEASKSPQVLEPQPCQFDVSKYDRRRSALDQKKAAGDAINQMLREIDSCLSYWSLGGHASATDPTQSQDDLASSSMLEGAGDSPLAESGENTSQAAATEQPTPQIETIEHVPLATEGKGPSRLAKAIGNIVDKMTPNSKAQNEFEDQLNRNEIALDEYAQTLYESYQQETDPVLKQELFDTLQLYLDQES